MNIPFLKMHSDGNDFVIIDNYKLKANISSSNIKNLADRNTGIGFDQLILMEKSEEFDVCIKIFNADGNEVEMCGNAARCVASLILTKNKKFVVIETISHKLVAFLEKNGDIKVSMKIPSQNKKFFYLSEKIKNKNIDFSSVNKEFFSGMLVNMGNPHIVFIVSNLRKVKLENYGEKIEKHFLFKKHINVEVVQIINKNKIKIAFWERGAGLTKSCGSGIMAAFYSCLRKKACNTAVEAILPGGKVLVSLLENQISVRGKAIKCFAGEFKNVQ